MFDHGKRLAMTGGLDTSTMVEFMVGPNGTIVCPNDAQQMVQVNVIYGAEGREAMRDWLTRHNAAPEAIYRCRTCSMVIFIDV